MCVCVFVRIFAENLPENRACETCDAAGTLELDLSGWNVVGVE